MSTRNTPSFGRAGRPRKINFSDLFLWETSIEFELTGVSLTELLGETDPKLLALYQDIGRKRKVSIERAKQTLPSALESAGHPLADEIRKGLSGEDTYLLNLGPWECYIYSRSLKPNGISPPDLSPLGKHFIEIERELKEPTLAWQQRDIARCAELLERSKVVALYLWPAVISRLRKATSVQEEATARCMVMLEIFLSSIACWDSQLQVDGFADHSVFSALFPDFNSEDSKHPNSIFFDWLEAYTGTTGKLADHVHQISKPAKDTDIGSTKRQLRRWKSGAGFPALDVFDALFRNLYGEKAGEQGNPRRTDWGLSWSMVNATRRINFLLPILLPLRKIREPIFPFGHECVQEWREIRYEHWYRYWLPLLDKRL